MSDSLRHECGVAIVRLKKPLDYFFQKYGTPLYGLFRLFLLMEKQHNRGQDGAGIAAVKFGMPPGAPYMFRERNIKQNPLDRIFRDLLKDYRALIRDGIAFPEFPATVKTHFDFGAELYLGHLRYGTSGGYHMGACHPFFRRSSWPTRNLILAGNFNMTNTLELNESLIAMGQHPIFVTDTQALLEKVGFYLDEAHDDLYHRLRTEGLSGEELSKRMMGDLDPAAVVRAAAARWDGGYSIIGAIGNGDAFVLRDPNGIRPVFYFEDDEVFAVASERAPLMTVFDKSIDEIQEVPPGQILVMKRDGTLKQELFTEVGERKCCSFERIYFSRGNDADIYAERKKLGGCLLDQILKAIDNDLERAVFGFIPNTAEVAYFGMMEALRLRRRQDVKAALLKAASEGSLTEELIDDLILRNWPRGEKVAHKDIKLRTFIGQEKWRNELVSHVYDITYGIAGPEDSLVCVDDSIVRGTTLRKSILRILARLNPKRIVIVSTAPQIRYPDCYGIDMSELGKFIAFEATIALLKERGQEDLIKDVYHACLEQVALPPSEMRNEVRRLYDGFTADEVSAKIASLVAPTDLDWKGEVIVIYQTIENLHRALPDSTGDWYFTGHYPTPGGVRVVNQAFINYFEDSDVRSY
ncbi:MAG: amidophosphoribosyltransferase [Verrucomicrobia bacterium]|nr:MAG: amidophosphoribosyltransferase [Verrucomicrobiota bacterium]